MFWPGLTWMKPFLWAGIYFAQSFLPAATPISAALMVTSGWHPCLFIFYFRHQGGLWLLSVKMKRNKKTPFPHRYPA